ncbi:hypothetical protein [Sporomusa termitida]|uniref:Uncharacterized protein n=1 Tax=Sporomusa termitida TaxID=2377 RepID=A0A517DSC8_9FIRM|nr:hypothetical protein [Sporomusa termitida]QDR80271.1 hypothetical protein SPTER_15910 [Sporomusa termitida]
MEDILEVYAMPYEETIPLICMDEQPYQLLDDLLKPLPMEPGKVRKENYEYVRQGACSIFVFTEPVKGVPKLIGRFTLRNYWMSFIQTQQKSGW